MRSKQLWGLCIRKRKACTFLVGVNNITFWCVGRNHLTLKFKEILMYYVTCYAIFNVVKH